MALKSVSLQRTWSVFEVGTLANEAAWKGRQGEGGFIKQSSKLLRAIPASKVYHVHFPRQKRAFDTSGGGQTSQEGSPKCFAERVVPLVSTLHGE